MLTLKNVPPEIYAAALDLEGWKRPPRLEDCREAYDAHAAKSGNTGALERAVYDYMSRSGIFSEILGEFSGISGYVIE